MPRSRPVAVLATCAVLMLPVLTVAGCGGTKVLTARKTILFEGRIYNVSTVQEVRLVRQLILVDGSLRDPSELVDPAPCSTITIGFESVSA